MSERIDALHATLSAAITKAITLNEQSGKVLEKALNEASRGGVFSDDYRYRYAHQMLSVYIRAHNVAAKYSLKELKERKKAKK